MKTYEYYIPFLTQKWMLLGYFSDPKFALQKLKSDLGVYAEEAKIREVKEK